MSEVAATFMRGGTSKGVFFTESDLPRRAAERDALLLRIIGSPDPYERHTDGMGGGYLKHQQNCAGGAVISR